jgi:multiple sugar transport system substrate-binding protein
MVELRGMTWNHPRGVDPLVACSRALEAELNARVSWDARSLEDFEAFPLDELASRYDLMVIDHPHVGMAAASGCLKPFDDALATGLAGSTVGRSHESYFWQRKQWALAIDAAAQVSARRSDARLGWPASLDEVVSLARGGVVLWPLAPVHALMSFFTLVAGHGAPCAIAGPVLVTDRAIATQVLELMIELASFVPAECFEMNPIAVFEKMKRDARFLYTPLIYGYVSYAREGAIEFADLPGGLSGSTLGGTGIAVSALSKHVDVATRFANRVAGSALQRTIYASAGGQPAHREAWRDETVNADARRFYTNTIRTLDTSWLRPRWSGYIGFQQRAGLMVSQCLRREASVAHALDALDAAFAEART